MKWTENASVKYVFLLVVFGGFLNTEALGFLQPLLQMKGDLGRCA